MRAMLEWRIKGGGRLAPISGLSHPLPTSPVEGEVQACGRGRMVRYAR